jgi:carbonic anhydrase
MKKLYFCFIILAIAAVAQHPSSQPISAREALNRLDRGNSAYLAGQFDPQRAGRSRRIEVAAGQHPFATILACADSRVAPELVFAQGLGDLFVVRVAGAVADKSVLGSIEYAASR